MAKMFFFFLVFFSAINYLDKLFRLVFKLLFDIKFRLRIE